MKISSQTYENTNNPEKISLDSRKSLMVSYAG